jgi:cysteine sulfinate desulfinase/cysteine desulfurase-like protein
VDITELGVDSLAFSSTTLGGSHGSGAAVLREGRELPPEAVPELVCGPNPTASCAMTAAIEARFKGLVSASKHVTGLKDSILKGLDSCGISYSIIGGKSSLPGTALLELNGRFDRIHARMEKDGVVLPSYNSSRRLSFLRRTGWDISRPDRYLGFSLDTINTGLDAEHFLRCMSTAMGR